MADLSPDGLFRYQEAVADNNFRGCSRSMGFASNTSSAVAFAACKSVSYEAQLSTVCVDERVVESVRLLVRIEPADDDEEEEVAIPDPRGLGLRAVHSIRCAVDPGDEAVYRVKVAGPSGSVQWLKTATTSQYFPIVANLDGKESFNVLAFT